MNTDSPIQATITSRWVYSIVNAVESIPELAMIEPAKLLSGLGVNEDQLKDPNAQIETEKMTAFWNAARNISGRVDIGLLVAEKIELCNMQSICFILLTSDNLKEMLNNFIQFFKAVTNCARLDIKLKKHCGHLIYTPLNLSVPLADEAVDAAMGSILNLLRRAISLTYSPEKIYLRRQAPVTRENCFTEFWGCEVAFSQSHNAIKIARSDLKTSLGNANFELNALNKEFLTKKLTTIKINSVEHKIRSLLPQLLPSGRCNQETIAESLNMSVSSLHRKLRTEGLRYRELVDEVKQSMASHYLKHSKIPVTDIAFNLGFNDASNFTRAFRRWFNENPRTFRQQQFLE